MLLVLTVNTIAGAQAPIASGLRLESWFDSQIGAENSGLINGQQYKMKFIGGKTNPFFQEAEHTGSVQFNGQAYYAVLLYDIYQDVLVLKHKSASGQVWFVQLDKKLVSDFSLTTHSFTKINDRFFEVIYHGQRFDVLAKRAKDQTIAKGATSYFITDEFFLVDGEKWFKIKKPSDMLRPLDQSSDMDKVRQFLKEGRIKGRKFATSDLARIASFMETIIVKKEHQ